MSVPVELRSRLQNIKEMIDRCIDLEGSCAPVGEELKKLKKSYSELFEDEVANENYYTEELLKYKELIRKFSQNLYKSTRRPAMRPVKRLMNQLRTVEESFNFHVTDTLSTRIQLVQINDTTIKENEDLKRQIIEERKKTEELSNRTINYEFMANQSQCKVNELTKEIEELKWLTPKTSKKKMVPPPMSMPPTPESVCTSLDSSLACEDSLLSISSFSNSSSDRFEIPNNPTMTKMGKSSKYFRLPLTIEDITLQSEIVTQHKTDTVITHHEISDQEDKVKEPDLVKTKMCKKLNTSIQEKETMMSPENSVVPEGNNKEFDYEETEMCKNQYPNIHNKQSAVSLKMSKKLTNTKKVESKHMLSTSTDNNNETFTYPEYLTSDEEDNNVHTDEMEPTPSRNTSGTNIVTRDLHTNEASETVDTLEQKPKSSKKTSGTGIVSEDLQTNVGSETVIIDILEQEPKSSKKTSGTGIVSEDLQTNVGSETVIIDILVQEPKSSKKTSGTGIVSEDLQTNVGSETVIIDTLEQGPKPSKPKSSRKTSGTNIASRDLQRSDGSGKMINDALEQESKPSKKMSGTGLVSEDLQTNVGSETVIIDTLEQEPKPSKPKTKPKSSRKTSGTNIASRDLQRSDGSGKMINDALEQEPKSSHKTSGTNIASRDLQRTEFSGKIIIDTLKQGPKSSRKTSGTGIVSGDLQRSEGSGKVIVDTLNQAETSEINVKTVNSLDCFAGTQTVNLNVEGKSITSKVCSFGKSQEDTEQFRTPAPVSYMTKSVKGKNQSSYLSPDPDNIIEVCDFLRSPTALTVFEDTCSDLLEAEDQTDQVLFGTAESVEVSKQVETDQIPANNVNISVEKRENTLQAEPTLGSAEDLEMKLTGTNEENDLKFKPKENVDLQKQHKIPPQKVRSIFSPQCPSSIHDGIISTIVDLKHENKYGTEFTSLPLTERKYEANHEVIKNKTDLKATEENKLVGSCEESNNKSAPRISQQNYSDPAFHEISVTAEVPCVSIVVSATPQKPLVNTGSDDSATPQKPLVNTGSDDSATPQKPLVNTGSDDSATPQKPLVNTGSDHSKHSQDVVEDDLGVKSKSENRSNLASSLEDLENMSLESHEESSKVGCEELTSDESDKDDFEEVVNEIDITSDAHIYAGVVKDNSCVENDLIQDFTSFSFNKTYLGDRALDPIDEEMLLKEKYGITPLDSEDEEMPLDLSFNKINTEEKETTPQEIKNTSSAEVKPLDLRSPLKKHVEIPPAKTISPDTTKVSVSVEDYYKPIQRKTPKSRSEMVSVEKIQKSNKCYEKQNSQTTKDVPSRNQTEISSSQIISPVTVSLTRLKEAHLDRRKRIAILRAQKDKKGAIPLTFSTSQQTLNKSDRLKRHVKSQTSKKSSKPKKEIKSTLNYSNSQQYSQKSPSQNHMSNSQTSQRSPESLMHYNMRNISHKPCYSVSPRPKSLSSESKVIGIADSSQRSPESLAPESSLRSPESQAAESSLRSPELQASESSLRSPESLAPESSLRSPESQTAESSPRSPELQTPKSSLRSPDSERHYKMRKLSSKPNYCDSKKHSPTSCESGKRTPDSSQKSPQLQKHSKKKTFPTSVSQEYSIDTLLKEISHRPSKAQKQSSSFRRRRAKHEVISHKAPVEVAVGSNSESNHCNPYPKEIEQLFPSREARGLSPIEKPNLKAHIPVTETLSIVIPSNTVAVSCVKSTSKSLLMLSNQDKNHVEYRLPNYLADLSLGIEQDSQTQQSDLHWEINQDSKTCNNGSQIDSSVIFSSTKMIESFESRLPSDLSDLSLGIEQDSQTQQSDLHRGIKPDSKIDSSVIFSSPQMFESFESRLQNDLSDLNLGMKQDSQTQQSDLHWGINKDSKICNDSPRIDSSKIFSSPQMFESFDSRLPNNLGHLHLGIKQESQTKNSLQTCLKSPCGNSSIANVDLRSKEDLQNDLQVYLKSDCCISPKSIESDFSNYYTEEHLLDVKSQNKDNGYFKEQCTFIESLEGIKLCSFDVDDIPATVLSNATITSPQSCKKREYINVSKHKKDLSIKHKAFRLEDTAPNDVFLKKECLETTDNLNINLSETWENKKETTIDEKTLFAKADLTLSPVNYHREIMNLSYIELENPTSESTHEEIPSCTLTYSKKTSFSVRKRPLLTKAALKLKMKVKRKVTSLSPMKVLLVPPEPSITNLVSNGKSVSIKPESSNSLRKMLEQPILINKGKPKQIREKPDETPKSHKIIKTDKFEDRPHLNVELQSFKSLSANVGSEKALLQQREVFHNGLDSNVKCTSPISTRNLSPHSISTEEINNSPVACTEDDVEDVDFVDDEDCLVMDVEEPVNNLSDFVCKPSNNEASETSLATERKTSVDLKSSESSSHQFYTDGYVPVLQPMPKATCRYEEQLSTTNVDVSKPENGMSHSSSSLDQQVSCGVATVPEVFQFTADLPKDIKKEKEEELVNHTESIPDDANYLPKFYTEQGKIADLEPPENKKMKIEEPFFQFPVHRRYEQKTVEELIPKGEKIEVSGSVLRSVINYHNTNQIDYVKKNTAEGRKQPSQKLVQHQQISAKKVAELFDPFIRDGVENMTELVKLANLLSQYDCQSILRGMISTLNNIAQCFYNRKQKILKNKFRNLFALDNDEWSQHSITPPLPPNMKATVVLLVMVGDRKNTCNKGTRFFEEVMDFLESVFMGALTYEESICLEVFMFMGCVYSSVARLSGALVRVRVLLYDILYSLKAQFTAFSILKTWPAVLHPRPIRNYLGDPIALAVIHCLTTVNCEDTKTNSKFPSVKMAQMFVFLWRVYKFNGATTNPDMLFDMFLSRLTQRDVHEAIILLCKKRGRDWFSKRPLKLLIEVVQKWRVKEEDDARTVAAINVMGCVARSYPLASDLHCVQPIFELFREFLTDKDTPEWMQEAIVLNLCRLARINWDLCLDLVLSWRPLRISTQLVDRIMLDIVQQRYISWWTTKGQGLRHLNKR